MGRCRICGANAWFGGPNFHDEECPRRKSFGRLDFDDDAEEHSPKEEK